MFPYDIITAVGVSIQLVIAAWIFHRLHLRWTGVFITALVIPILMDVLIQGDITILRMTFFLLYGTAALVRALYLNGLHHDTIKERKDHKH